MELFLRRVKQNVVHLPVKPSIRALALKQTLTTFIDLNDKHQEYDYFSISVSMEFRDIDRRLVIYRVLNKYRSMRLG